MNWLSQRMPNQYCFMNSTSVSADHTFSGVVLGYAGREMFPAYYAAHRTWGPSLVDDLHIGGAMMWIGGDALMFVFIMIVVATWARDPRAVSAPHGWLESVRRANLEHLTATSQAGQPGASPGPGRRGGGQATADDDEHLAAYNAYLARIHGQGDDPEAGG